MGYLCLSCFNEYDSNLLKLDKPEGYYYRCPNKKCGDLNLVEIDDLILPIIKLLNIKGYKTTYCCSAHAYENENHCANTYIAFDSEFVPKIIPKGFTLENEEYYNKQGWDWNTDDICIRKYYKEGLSEYELHQRICKTIIDLMKWAENLPYNDYEE